MAGSARGSRLPYRSGIPGERAFSFQAGTCREEHPMWSAISRSLPRFAPARLPHTRRRPKLERLEERAMLSTIALTVNTLADDPEGSVTGQTTLRDAITTADAGTGNQYVIKFAVKGTIDLTGALPALDNNIAIKGPGAKNLTVQRNPTASPFRIFTVDTGDTVNISGLTIAGGYTHDGGGLDNFGTLTVSNSVFSSNFAGGGGGLYNESGATATVIGSTFTRNSADLGGGGGLENFGTATVIGSTFSSNGADGGGGGLENFGTATVIGSTFTRNGTGSYGGGISNLSFNGGPATVTVVGSTFTSNSADSFDGGGLANFSVNGGPATTTATVIGSTFTRNSASAGGGIANESGGTATVIGSTFTGNSGFDQGGGGILNGSFNGGPATATVIGSTFTSNSTDLGY